MDKDECVKAMKKADSMVDGVLTVNDYKDLDLGGPVYRTIVNKFGTWNNAKEAAGLNTLKRGVTKESKNSHKYRTDHEGYERVSNRHDGEANVVGVHRLVAVSEFGFDAVSGKVVHHKNNIPWDNRPSNLELMNHAEHARYHRKH